ncbi:MAG: Crp/Fnr family transcriptional regulator [Proteobacteria bacterium]|nr:Crp/Fnr family transcriptional regulator [Pseudomonadota bacterium]
MVAAAATAEFTAPDRAMIRAAFGCGDPLVRVIGDLCHLAEAPAGARLFPRDDSGETVLLLAGEAREVAYGRNGAVLVLHRLVAGEFYGTLVDLGSDGTPPLVEADSATRGAHFSGPALVRLMESYSCVAVAITRQLARRLEQMRQRMAETVLLSAVGRVCAELARLAQANADQTIRPVPVFTELAVTSQTTRETVSRTVSQLEARGIFERVDGGLRLVAPHRLDELIC